MFERLAQIESRYEEIESSMVRPEILADMDEYKNLLRNEPNLKV
jgi:protein subunit release factor A